MTLVNFLCHLIKFQQYVYSFTVRASTSDISFIAEHAYIQEEQHQTKAEFLHFCQLEKIKIEVL